MVAVAERFTLASLMIFDMRAVLRDLDRRAGRGRLMRRAAKPQPHDRSAGSPATPTRPPRYLRRRRMTRKPVRARLHAGGRTAAYAPETEEGRALFLAAAS